MPGLVLILPIVTGKVEAWRRFCQELDGSRRPSYQASRLRLGIILERLALLENPFAATSVMTIEADEMSVALAGIIGSQLPFECWYRERLEECHGITLASYGQFAVPGPPDPHLQVLFEWTMPNI